MRSNRRRRLADNVVNAADPGRGYREKLRNVELVGSVDSKRALAEECIRMGRFADAIELYESAMQGPLGGCRSHPAEGAGAAPGCCRATGAEAEALFVKLKRWIPPPSMPMPNWIMPARWRCRARMTRRCAQFEKVVSRYPGEEARARFGLLLESLGQQARAQALFSEILKSVKGAPCYYRSRQREWVSHRQVAREVTGSSAS